jgi:hypothetical protein
VGKTVKAGTYRAPGPGSNCYWQRLKAFGGSTDDVRSNNNTGDPAVVTIAPADKGFQTSGCGTWTSDLSQITKSKTSFGPGTYIVKTDIDPGTYSAPGGGACYWARLSGFGGTTNDILANDIPSGRVVVTIAASDKGFESRGCGTFTKSSAPAPASPPTAEPSSPSAASGTFGDGTYTVGKTVKAGTYRAPGPGSNCYWARLKDFGGSVDDIIANNNTGDPAVVTIAPSDKGFQTSGCGTWTSDLSQITKSKTSFGPGTYIVNTDIEPGTYDAVGGTCYWSRFSGFGGTISDILANGNPTGRVVVTIAASDKGFESRGCGTFTKTSAPPPASPTTEAPSPTTTPPSPTTAPPS